MATRFQIWVDYPTDQNSLSYIDLLNDPQRNTGFVSGTAASSSRVNSMLRQDSLVVAALMDSIAPDSDLDLRSAFTDVKEVMLNYFGQFIVSGRYVSDTNSIELTLKSGQIVNISLAELLQKTIARAIADKDGNEITSTYVTNTMFNALVSNIDSLGTITTVNGIQLRFFVGTKSAYDALPPEDKTNVFAVITDDDSKAVFDQMVQNVTNILNGTISVGKAEKVVTKFIRSSDELMQIVTTPYQSVFFVTSQTSSVSVIDDYGESTATEVFPSLPLGGKGWLIGTSDYLLVSFSPYGINSYNVYYYDSETKRWTANIFEGFKSNGKIRSASYLDGSDNVQTNTYYNNANYPNRCDISIAANSLYSVMVNVAQNSSEEYFATVLIDSTGENYIKLPYDITLSYFGQGTLSAYNSDNTNASNRIYKARRLTLSN